MDDDNDPNGTTHSILIVEDYRASQTMLTNAIKFNKKVNCDTVSSGNEALVKIKERLYDIVITDMRMPGMDGLELIKLIRQYEHENYFQEQIIIAMSVDDLKTEALASGATMFISKSKQPMRKIFETIDSLANKEKPSRRKSCLI